MCVCVLRTHPSRKHQDLAPPPACSLPNPVAGRFEDMALHWTIASDGFSLFSQPIQAMKPAMKPDGSSRKHTTGSDSVLTYKLKLQEKMVFAEEYPRSIQGVSKISKYQSWMHRSTTTTMAAMAPSAVAHHAGPQGFSPGPIYGHFDLESHVLNMWSGMGFHILRQPHIRHGHRSQRNCTKRNKEVSDVHLRFQERHTAGSTQKSLAA